MACFLVRFRLLTALVFQALALVFLIHTKWHLAMAGGIIALERIGTWDIVSLPRVRPITWWECYDSL